jgi:hypothetical protein
MVTQSVGPSERDETRAGSARAPHTASVVPSSASGASGRSALLAMQRTAGNRATIAAMRLTVPGARATHPTLSRCQGACKCGGACKKSGPSDELLGELGRRSR